MQLPWEGMPLMGVVSSCLVGRKVPLKPSTAQPATATETSTEKKLKVRDPPVTASTPHTSTESGGNLMNKKMVVVVIVARPPQLVKKRFRTKFSQEQKEKMLSFAEKVGWKIQKQEEAVVQQFCQEIGVKRRVLKVWMHNNKHNLAKKTPLPSSDD
uniref:Zinc-finger homeodomain protein 4 n=1 Tax=Vitis vinifera TaxID=29760 RepID=A5AUK3_VITVI|nr:hypothetical protein VITISV_003253 [Vitis vinifera]